MCGNIPNLPQQDISYTAFNKTCTISEGNYHLEYFYGPDQQRRKSELKNNDTTVKTIIYAGNYEEFTNASGTYKVHYIAGGSGLTAINVRYGNNDQLFYVYTDHLGSILKLVNAAGTVDYEQNFDAWGRQRNPDDWTYSANLNPPPDWLIRGFTGHEHLKEFALINMNGRMYDPVIGRVLSPDNYVADPFFTQDHNRYSYVRNNPLKYIDPSGERGHRKQFNYFGMPFKNNQGGGGNYGSSGAPDLSWTTGLTGGDKTEMMYQAALQQALYELYLEYSYVPLPKLNVATINAGAQFLERKLPEVNVTGSGSSQEVAQSGGGRPDADSYLTIEEANNWYRRGNGQPLNVDLGKIDLSGISPSDFPSGVGSKQTFNLLHPAYFKSVNEGLVYGSITLTLDKGNTVHATRGYDIYDFDIKPWSISTFGRNVETYIGSWYAGPGTSYYIYLQGAGYIGK